MDQESLFAPGAEFVSQCRRDYPGCPCLTCGHAPVKNGVVCCYRHHKWCGQSCPDYEREGA